MTSPGFITPIEEIPTPDLAVPYAAPMSAKTGKSHSKECYNKSGVRQREIRLRTCAILSTFSRTVGITNNEHKSVMDFGLVFVAYASSIVIAQEAGSKW